MRMGKAKGGNAVHVSTLRTTKPLVYLHHMEKSVTVLPVSVTKYKHL